MQVRRDADFEPGGFGAVTAFHNLTDFVQASDDGALFLRHAEVEEFAFRTDLRANLREQARDAFASFRGDSDGVGIFFVEAVQYRSAFQTINLVEHHQHGLVTRADFLQDFIHRGDLFIDLLVAGIDDVQEQIGFDYFFECRLERFDETVRQFANETYRVREQDVLIGRQVQAAGGGVERGEENVLGHDTGAGELVKQGGLAGVGVTDDGSERPLLALATRALNVALTANGVQIAGDAINTLGNLSAVGFELGFTFTPAHTDTAFLTRQVAPKPRQARQQVLKLREFDLQLAFASAGALGEDVENECGAIEDLGIENLFEVAALRGRKFVVEDDGIGVLLAAKGGEFVSLAFADVRSGMWGFELLDAFANNFTAGGGGKFAEFIQ